MRHHELTTLLKILLLLLISLLSLILFADHSTLAALQLQDVENHKLRAESVINQLQDMYYSQEEGEKKIVRRKELHEVHSGTNPIGNSVPQQKRINMRD